MERTRAIAALALAALLGGPPAGGAQEAPVPVFGETVEVRVVNLEVVVTDRDGLPVTGLAAADFRLLVDGVEQPVRYFSEVRGGAAIAPEAAAVTAEIEGVPSLVPGEPVGSSYLVFVDDFFAIERDRDRVLQALRDDVARLGAEDRMAIVAFDGNSLTLLSSWTNSARELERALRDAQARPAKGLQRVAERRSFQRDRRLTGGGFPGVERARLGALDTRLSVDERFFAESLERQVENVVSSAAAALRGFANPPGRKVLILLSGGWPYEIDEYVANQFGRLTAEPGVQSGARLYAPLVDTANQLGYTIFAVDVPGLASEGVADAELDAVPEDETRFSSFLRENNVQYTLQRVATATGGKALLNAGRLEALRRAEAATRSYYWIGFTPTWKGDDRRHAVEVEVRREGLRVASREGYVDFSRRAEISAAVESVLLFGAGPGVRDLDLELGRPQPAGRSMQVPIALSLPLDELTLLPSGQAGERVAELELRVAALDDRGGRSDIPVLPFRLTLPAEVEAGARARYQTRLELRKVKNRVVVAVYDPLSGAIWSKTAEIRP
jgi:VWFA-related protein